jgi:hypothetical protein
MNEILSTEVLVKVGATGLWAKGLTKRDQCSLVSLTAILVH